MKKTFKLFVLTIISAVMLVSCDNADQPAQTSLDPNKPKIALVMKSLANEFFVAMGKGAEKHQSGNSDKYDLILNGIKDETDLAQQVVLIDQMIAAGVDAIVIAPADSKAIVPALARARDAGIYVVNIDNKLDDAVLQEHTLTVPFVGPDNREGAKNVALTLAKTLALFISL